MPLRCEFLPFLFGALIGRELGAFLAPDRLQMILLGYVEFGDALVGGHLPLPEKGREHNTLSHR